MAEQWVRWEPTPGLSAKYTIVAVIDDESAFSVRLAQETKHTELIRVLFPMSVDAYRYTDESFRVSTIQQLNTTPDARCYPDWTFFRVYHSRYIQWLSEQSHSFSDYLPLIHFALIDSAGILDIVAPYEPEIEEYTKL